MTPEMEFAATPASAEPAALPPPPLAPPATTSPSVASSRQWAMFLHLSQLLGWFLPIAGLVAPLVIWQIKKNELPELDAHGKVVANWVISALIYGVAFGLLSIVLIGIPLLLALVLACVILPVVGALKANDGEVWRYPLSFRIF